MGGSHRPPSPLSRKGVRGPCYCSFSYRFVLLIIEHSMGIISRASSAEIASFFKTIAVTGEQVLTLTLGKKVSCITITTAARAATATVPSCIGLVTWTVTLWGIFLVCPVNISLSSKTVVDSDSFDKTITFKTEMAESARRVSISLFNIFVSRSGTVFTTTSGRIKELNRTIKTRQTKISDISNFPSRWSNLTTTLATLFTELSLQLGGKASLTFVRTIMVTDKLTEVGLFPWQQLPMQIMCPLPTRLTIAGLSFCLKAVIAPNGIRRFRGAATQALDRLVMAL